MEAACHKDRSISKKAVQCIHDSMTALLNEQVELAHFHFNEALFKPFENLLCLELCDSDVQDQVRKDPNSKFGPLLVPLMLFFLLLFLLSFVFFSFTFFFFILLFNITLFPDCQLYL